MPEPFRTISDSAVPITCASMNISRSTPWLAAIASGEEPSSATATSPDAMAAITSGPALNLRHSISQPVGRLELLLGHGHLHRGRIAEIADDDLLRRGRGLAENRGRLRGLPRRGGIRSVSSPLAGSPLGIRCGCVAKLTIAATSTSRLSRTSAWDGALRP